MEKLKHGQLETWLWRAYAGDGQAQENLHGYIGPRLLARTSSIFPSDPLSDDLISLTFYRIDTRLADIINRFEGNKRTVSSIFVEWCFSQLNQLIAETPPDRYLETASRHTIGDFIPDYEERAEQIILDLSPAVRRVVRPLIFEDQTISEVAERLVMSELAVRQALHRGRVYMEPKLLTPFGIGRVSALKDRRLLDAVTVRHLEGFKFLNFWYTDEQAIERYKANLETPRRIILPPQIDKEILRRYHADLLSPNSDTNRDPEPDISY